LILEYGEYRANIYTTARPRLRYKLQMPTTIDRFRSTYASKSRVYTRIGASAATSWYFWGEGARWL